MLSSRNSQFVWHDICSKDAASTQKFFKDLFGWVSEPYGEPGKYSMCKMGGKACGGIKQLDSGEPFITSFFQVADIKAVVKSLTEDLPGTVISKVCEFPNQGFHAEITTSDGARLGLWQNIGKEEALVQDVGFFCWHDLHSSDVAKSAAILAALGLTVTPAPSVQEGYNILTAASGGSGAGAAAAAEGEEGGAKPSVVYAGAMMANRLSKAGPSQWLPYIKVAAGTLTDTAARVTALGGTVAHGPRALGKEGALAVVVDPTGVQFALWEQGNAGNSSGSSSGDADATAVASAAAGAGGAGGGAAKESKAAEEEGKAEGESKAAEGAAAKAAAPSGPPTRPFGNDSRVVWHDLVSSDVPATLKFCKDVLGWESSSMPMPEGAEGLYHFATLPGQSPACGVVAAAAGVPSHQVAYTQVPDLKASTAQAVVAGGSVTDPPTVMPGQGSYCTLRDPSGAAFGLWQTEDVTKQPLPKFGKVGLPCWEELLVAPPAPPAAGESQGSSSGDGIAAASAFYKGLLGWDIELDPKIPIPYHLIRHTSDRAVMGDMFSLVGGIVSATHATNSGSSAAAPPSPQWLTYYMVEGPLETVESAAAQAGGTVVKTRSPIAGGYFSLLADPTGLLIPVWESRAASKAYDASKQSSSSSAAAAAGSKRAAPPAAAAAAADAAPAAPSSPKKQKA